MIDADNIYRYLGLAIVVILAILFVMRCMRMQLNVMEGMIGFNNSNGNSNGNSNSNSNGNSNSFFESSNSNDPQAQAIEQIADAVKANGDKIEDALLLDKYKSNYEDIIINLEAVITDTMLSSLKPLAEQISKDPTSATNLTAMSSLNSLNTFRSTLDDMMTALDKKSSLTSGASNLFGSN